MCAPLYSGFIRRDAEIVAPTREDYEKSRVAVHNCPVGGFVRLDDKPAYRCSGCGTLIPEFPPSLLANPCSHTSVASYFGLDQDDLLPIEYDWTTRETSLDLTAGQIVCGWFGDLLHSESDGLSLQALAEWQQFSNSRVADQIRRFGEKRVPDVDTLLGLMEFWWVDAGVKEKALGFLPNGVEVPVLSVKTVLEDRQAACKVLEHDWHGTKHLGNIGERAKYLMMRNAPDRLKQAILDSLAEGNSFDVGHTQAWSAVQPQLLAIITLPIKEQQTIKEHRFSDYADAFRKHTPEVWRN